MKNNLNKQFKSWMNHWYLAAKDSRIYFTPQAQKEEPSVYREIIRMINEVVSTEAPPIESAGRKKS